MLAVSSLTSGVFYFLSFSVPITPHVLNLISLSHGRETGQMPIFFYWFRCTIRFWNSLLSSNNPLLEKFVRADLLLANRRVTWTYQVLMRSKIYLHLNSFWMLYDLVRLSINDSLNSLFVNILLDLDILTPHEAHHSSRIMSEDISHTENMPCCGFSRSSL